MSRLQADLLLLLTALIWGAAFIAQKTGMNGLGPLGFIGIRFSLSFLLILPFAIREFHKTPQPALRPHAGAIFALCLSFFMGSFLQQAGLLSTSVTNAGFLTGVYVVVVPFIARLAFRQKVRGVTWVACAVALAGIWLLGGASLAAFAPGDWLVLAGAFFFAAHVVLIGFLAAQTGMPLVLSALQYGALAALGLGGAALFEPFSAQAVLDNLGPLLYAGILSGGLAYTFQAIAQRHTPAADAAVILSAESLFAALAGAVLLDERLGPTGWAGAALIFTAILLVEIGPLIYDKYLRKGTA